ncbi:hypothetical protein CRV08_04680 [Halarcobacter ebronensis]|uniref:LysM domain-containing protein n=1 Tax=Halarcobacter ebronensis TaxID=1462615 RepID=A0A4V1LRT4_9BACT|nr:hypothetical protein [Halarcobacter ebronensis]RXJ69308.1 hypothetical protein CRV08_04680 [Halarcobacter ebronensis]
MPTNVENDSNLKKDFLDISNLKGETNGVNSTFGKVNEYLGKGSDVAAVFNSDPMIGKTLGYFSNKAAIIDAIDSGINGGYNGFMSSVAGTFSGASAAMLVASLAPQAKGISLIFKMGLALYVGDEVGGFVKETFLNKEYRQLEFDPYDTQTHKFENGKWYEKGDNGSLTLIEDNELINNLTQGAEESQNFNFYKNSTGEVVIEPKNPAFGEYYNIKTNGDIQTISDNGLTVTTKQTDGVIRVETFNSTEDSKDLTSLTVINPDGTYDYKNKVTGDWVKNSADEYIQTIKTSGADGLNIKQIIINKSTGKAVIKKFDGEEWETKEYNSSSEVNKYIKDGGKFEYVDENSSVISNPDGSKIVFHKTEDNKEEKYVLDKDGNLKNYEIKNENGEYQKYEGSSLDEMSEQEVQSISDALNDSTYSKSKIENAINNLDKSNLKEPTEVGVVPLQEGQTISHIAQNTPYNSIELLEYNNLTLEQAKHLPVGFEVKIPKDVTVVDGEYGAIKIYEGYDETGVIVTPNEKITYDENSDLLIYGDNDKITFTDTDGTYQEFLKDSNGNIYKSLESNDNFTISYDNKNTVTNIEITGDNVSLDDVANLTEYSKEDLKAFNILDSDTLTKGTNIQQPVSKTVYEGNITQYDAKDGNSIFTVPNSDGTSTTYGTFTDGFENQAYYEKEVA